MYLPIFRSICFGDFLEHLSIDSPNDYKTEWEPGFGYGMKMFSTECDSHYRMDNSQLLVHSHQYLRNSNTVYYICTCTCTQVHMYMQHGHTDT